MNIAVIFAGGTGVRMNSQSKQTVSGTWEVVLLHTIDIRVSSVLIYCCRMSGKLDWNTEK